MTPAIKKLMSLYIFYNIHGRALTQHNLIFRRFAESRNKNFMFLDMRRARDPKILETLLLSEKSKTRLKQKF